MLNDLRITRQQPSLGFLNPFIYQNLAAWNDITVGANGGCNLGEKGYPAIKGWDAATGAGTPNFARLSKAVAALP